MWLDNADGETHSNKYRNYMPLGSDERKGVDLKRKQSLLALPCAISCSTTPALRRDDDDKHINSSISGLVFNVHEQLRRLPTPASVLASQVKEPGAERAAQVV